MVAQALEPAFVHAIAGVGPDRRRLSRTTAIAIAVSVAAHVAVGVYVYEAKYATIPTTAWTEGPTTTIDRTIVVKQPPPKHVTPPPPPRQLAVRPPRGPVTVQTPTAPFTPLVKPPAPLTDPPQLAANVIPQPPAPQTPSVITDPDWLKMPGPSEFSRFYPQAALDQDASGAATLSCTVAVTGAVRDCQVTAESPKGLGFGDAAKKLAPYFRLKPQMRDGAPVDGASIRIPIRFNLA